MQAFNAGAHVRANPSRWPLAPVALLASLGLLAGPAAAQSATSSSSAAPASASASAPAGTAAAQAGEPAGATGAKAGTKAGAKAAPRAAEVVVVGEREPGNFRIDAREIELTQADDLSDLLSNQSGVAVGGGAAVAQKVYVRGFEDTLLNVSIDNAQQPAELYHHQTRVQIEPEFIKSIELDAGAGAATLGAGALTGAIRISTRNAFDMLARYGREGQTAGVLVKGTAGLNGEGSGKGLVAGYARVGEELGAMVTHVRQHGGDYDDGHGARVAPTAYDHERSQVRLTRLAGEHSTDFSAEHLFDSGTYYERPHMVNFNGRFQLSDHRMTRDTVSLNHGWDPASEAIDLQLTLHHSNNRYDNHRNNTGALYGQAEQTTTGIDLRNTWRWSALELVAGAEYRRDALRARQQATPPTFWGSTEQSASVLGLYSQATWTPAPAWELSAGLRWDDYSHRVESGPGAGARNDASHLSPNLSLQWQPIEPLTLRAAYAQAFRGVTIREGFFSALYAHHGDLKGEQADNLELGIAWEQGGWFARATAFRQNIDHYINALYTGDTTDEWGRWANLGSARVDGYEIEAGRRWGDFELGLGVWNSDNRFEDKALTDADLGLGTSIGRTWTARLDWAPAGQPGRYGLRARHVQAERNLITDDAPDKPAYSVLDLLAEWTLGARKQYRVGLALSNLLDEFYYDHGSYGYHSSGKYIGFAAPGRELRLSLSANF